MKKKFIAGLAMLVAVMPFVKVNAASREVGQYVNYFSTAAQVSKVEAKEEGWEDEGFGTFWLADTDQDDGAGHKYSKVISSLTIGNSKGLTSTNTQTITSTDASVEYSALLEAIRNDVEVPYGMKDSDGKVKVDLATEEDLQAIFGTDSTIDITVGNRKEILEALTAFGGHATAYVFSNTTVDSGGNDVYVAIKVTAAAGEVTAAEYVTVAPNVDAWSYYAPVLYMNEGYNCDTAEIEEYACYECPSTTDTTGNSTIYSWTKKGTEGDKCKIVDTITSKSKCVKPAKTGVENYLVPVAIVLGVSLIVLTVVKRKDAFKAI